MARCPVCDAPGAYIGFNSIECRNVQCEHFKFEEEVICPCCGIAGHVPSEPAGSSPGNTTLSESYDDSGGNCCGGPPCDDPCSSAPPQSCPPPDMMSWAYGGASVTGVVQSTVTTGQTCSSDEVVISFSLSPQYCDYDCPQD